MRTCNYKCKKPKHSTECKKEKMKKRREKYTGLDALIPTTADDVVIHGNEEITRGMIREYIDELNREIRLTLHLINEALSLSQIELAKQHTEEALKLNSSK